MVSALHRRADRAPDTPALTINGTTSTFAEIDQRTDQLACALLLRGVGEGDVVTIALPNSVQFIESAIAVLKVGGTIQPLSHRLPLTERRGIIKLADPRLVIGVDPADHPERDCVANLVEHAPKHADRLPVRVSESWKATTSGGTSGQPKLIMSTESAVIDEQAQPEYLLPRNGVVLIPGPLYHTAPFTISLLGLFHGNHVILEERFDPQLTVELIERYRPQFILLVPTMMNRIWRLPDSMRNVDMSSLTTVLHMASHCPEQLKQAWIDWVGAEQVFELYGASDSPANTVISGSEWLRHRGSVGRPHLGEVIITDDDGRTLPPGQVGEVWMRPPRGRPARSRVIGAQPRQRDGWTSVGDLGWMDESGYLYISDRRSDLIVSGGANIAPAEVEAALECHPGVRSSVVIGLPDDDLGQQVHAIVDVCDGVTEQDLRDHMATQLVRYKNPRSYELVDYPLRDDAGKVRKSSLVDARIRARRTGEPG